MSGREEGMGSRPPPFRLVPGDGAGEDDAQAQSSPGPDHREPHRRRRRRWLAWSCVVVLIVTGGALTVYLRRGTGRAASALQTVAVIPFWNFGPGVDSVVAHAATVSTVSPWMFGAADDGRVVPLSGADPDRQTAALRRIGDAGLKVMPTIANYQAGTWRPAPVQRMLHDQGLMNRHVQEIVTTASRQRWAGVDIDYEELHGEDRDAFSLFIQTLAGALHAQDLELSVDVFAKTTDGGYDQRNLAQDYDALGRAADRVRIMAYDYHWSTSPPGAIAPITWVRDVLSYARAHIPAEKILLGIPLYGYDWVGRSAKPVSWSQVYHLATTRGLPVRWDEASESPWLEYTDQGVHHVVWFENAYSAAAKIDVARNYGIGGIALWMYGAEDEVLWSKIRPGGQTCTPAGAGA